MDATSTRPVDELTSIDRETFLESYRFCKPFILRGGAKALPAFTKWSLEYLESRIADVVIQPLVYDEDQRDYSRAHFVEMSFREFCREIRCGNARTLYWFEGPVSANFWGGADKDARVNADLRMLAEDFVVPEFLRESEIIYAQMILGTGKNGTVAHHDFGGEAKCLMQLIGEKHVLLVAPQHGKHLMLHSIARPKNFTISTLDLRGKDFESICSQATVFEARIRPGDILYWPSFWLHDIANEGAINFAINAPIDEMPVNALMLRHLFAMNISLLRELDGELRIDPARIERIEQRLLDYTDVRTLWDLHAASTSYRGKHWRTRQGA
jgi:hypothetical protein